MSADNKPRVQFGQISFGTMIKPPTQPVTQPFSQPVSQPFTQPFIKPFTQPPTQPVIQPFSQQKKPLEWDKILKLIEVGDFTYIFDKDDENNPEKDVFREAELFTKPDGIKMDDKLLIEHKFSNTLINIFNDNKLSLFHIYDGYLSSMYGASIDVPNSFIKNINICVADNKDGCNNSNNFRLLNNYLLFNFNSKLKDFKGYINSIVRLNFFE